MIITELWRRMPGKFFCVSTKSMSGQWRDHFFSKGELSRIPTFLKDNADKDLYFCPHGLSDRSRKEAAAVPSNILWADLDEADPRTMDPKPTIAFESSPGRFVGLWLIDQPFRKEINKALTYHVGADKGGWDCGQVLRIPGTRNYKYDHQPRVRVLWDDGKVWKTRELKEILGSFDVASSDSGVSASDVYKRVERKLSPDTRSLFHEQRLIRGSDRSAVLWKLIGELLRVGCSVDECVSLLKTTIWNKHKSEEKLREDVERFFKKRMAQGGDDEGHAPIKEHTFFANPLSEVEIENVEWIWYGRIALGQLTIIEGDPGVGKSYLTQILCSHVCDGRAFPLSRDRVIAGNICYFDHENSPGTVTKKRLMCNGMKHFERFFQEPCSFTVLDAAAREQIENALERVKPRVIIFDTMNNYLGGVDSHKATETADAINWLQELATRYNCAVIALRHLTKSTTTSAIYRGQGSIAFAGAARIVLTVAKHPEDEEEKVLSVTKNNLSERVKSILYRIDSLPDKEGIKDRSHLLWGEESELTSDELLAAPTKKKDNAAENDAKEFLQDALDEGKLELSKLKIMAEKRGVGYKALKRAADSLGVMKDEVGFGGDKKTYWSLPS